MKQRKISDLIKDLNKVKKQFGDLDIKIHLKSMEDANGGEFSHDDFGMHVESISELDLDSDKLKRKKWTVLSLFAADYLPEDYKSKSLSKKLDLN